MAQSIECSRHHLHRRNGSRVVRIQDREGGRRPDDRTFPILFLIGYHRAGIHLGACSRSRHHGTHRYTVRREFLRLVLHVPDVLVQYGLGRYDLATVHYAAAPYRQDEIDALFLHQGRPLLSLVISRVGLDSRNLHHFLACVGKELFDFIIYPVFFHGAAAVGQHDGLSHLRELLLQRVRCRALSKIDFRRIRIRKLFHNSFLLYT